MSECYTCGGEAGYTYTTKNGKKSLGSGTAKKYCSRECRKQGTIRMKGQNQIHKISYSPHASSKEINKRKVLLDKARQGNETAILELRLRYGVKIVWPTQMLDGKDYRELPEMQNIGKKAE